MNSNVSSSASVEKVPDRNNAKSGAKRKLQHGVSEEPGEKRKKVYVEGGTGRTSRTENERMEGKASSKGDPQAGEAAEVEKRATGVGAVKTGKDSFEFFYGKASPFSQHHPCRFKVDGKEFNCAEQYMMYMKAVVFKDEDMQRDILKTSDPKQHKRLGRKVKNFDGSQWNDKCEEIVYEGNFAKFSQNPTLKASLLATKGRTLVEASGRDRKWGIGLGANNPKAWNPATWRGKNKLGFILTKIRDELLASSSNHSQTC